MLSSDDIPDASDSPLLRSLLADLETDPNVVGVVLTGSRARTGMATARSDIDVYVVLAAADPSRRTTRSPEIDLPVCTLDELRVIPGPADEGWWDRYSFTHSRVLLDRAAGEVDRLVNAWGTLSGPESKLVLETYLDGYLNFVYRSLKSERDGRGFESRLDANESLVWGLPLVFAFERRVRPYNKYLRWELEHHPLDRREWQADVLVPQLGAILDSGDPSAQRALVQSVETAAREVGLGGIVDGWGAELAVLHGDG